MLPLHYEAPWRGLPIWLRSHRWQLFSSRRCLRQKSRNFPVDDDGAARHDEYTVFVSGSLFLRGPSDLLANSLAFRGMNKAGLIDFVQKGMGRQASRVAADRAVSLVIEGIKSGLQHDKIVQLIGFGTFKVVERKARTAIHPKTRQPLKIRQSRTVKLTIGKELRDGI